MKIGASGAYTRGWEVFAHFFGMFRASVFRQVAISLFVGGLIAGFSIRGEFDSKALENFGEYVRVSIWAYSLPSRPIVITTNGRSEESLPASEAASRLQSLFGGREVSFILWQWFLRALTLSLLAGPALALAMIQLGRRLAKDKYRRGARLIDTTAWAYRHKNELRLAAVMVAGGFGAACLALLILLTPTGFLLVPHLACSWGAAHAPALAKILSPGWGGGVIWTPNPIGQLLPPARSYAAIVETLGGRGLPAVFFVSLAGAAFGSYVTGFISYRLRQRTAAKADNELGIGGVAIPRKREVYNFLICGAIGSGKTVANTLLLDKIRERNQRAVVLDTSGEYVEKFYRPGIDVVLNPFDSRSAHWTPWAEIRRPSDCLSLGESLFPKGGKDEFWALAGSSVFAGLLEHLSQWKAERNAHLAYLVERLGPEQLMQILKGTVGERFVDPGAKQTATSVVMTAAGQLRSFRFLPDPAPDEKPFSLREFVEATDTDRWIFVVMREEDQAAMKPLVSMWFDILMNAVLSLPQEDESTPHNKRRRLFFSLDELQALQKMPALEGALLRGRKKGLSVTLGIQSIKGVRAIYGQNEADSLLGQPQTQLVLRTPEEGTAKWLEGQLGNAEIERSSESQQMGVNSARDGISLQKAVAQEAVVLASEIQDLPDLHGYLKTIGSPVLKVALTFSERKPSQPGFEGALLEPAPVPPPSITVLNSMAQARQLMAEGRTAEASQLLREAKELVPTNDGELRQHIDSFQVQIEG